MAVVKKDLVEKFGGTLYHNKSSNALCPDKNCGAKQSAEKVLSRIGQAAPKWAL